MTAGQLAMPAAKPKPPIGRGGARPGAGRKTDEERGAGDYADYNRDRARREFHNANLAELEEMQKRGSLLPRDEMVAAYQGLVANCRAKLLSVPAKLAPQLLGVETMAEVEAILAESIREALAELERG